MSSPISGIEVEILSETSIHPLTKLSMELWQDSQYEAELINWRQIIDSPDNYCAVAKKSEEYVGFIHITIRKDYVEGSDADRTAYLEGIYIKPDYRRLNIATLLLNKGENWAKSKGLSHIASDTEIDNLLSQEFHQEMGFKEVNRIVCYSKDI